MRLLFMLCLIFAAACAPAPRATDTTLEQQPRLVAQASPPPTPFIFPTLPPSPTPACAGAPRERLVRFERGRVLPDDPRPLNMRREPGTSSRVVLQIPIRGVFYVLQGPVCADNYAWYQVRYLNSEGWIAEGDFTSYYVEPYLLQ